MKNPLLVSTGSFWDGKTYLDNVEAIRSIKQLNVEGIEVSFADQKLLGGFFNQEVKRLLGNFKIVGMHLPFWSYKKDNASQEMISKCYSVYKRIKADYAVLHMHWIKDSGVFKGSAWNIVIENGGSRHGFLVKDMQDFINKNPRFKMVLDVSHAYESDEIGAYVKKLKNRIFAVHLGGGEIAGSGRHKLFCMASKDYLESCKPIKKLDCPIIIESNWGKDIALAKKEIAFVRKWLKQES